MGYDVPDQAGKVFIVTGGNSGLGFAIASGLLRAHAKVYIAGRSKERCEAAIEKLKPIHHDVQWLPLDLSSIESSCKAGKTFSKLEQRLDGVMCNAGIAMEPYHLSADGIERQFATNHLGHFALIYTLLDILKRTASIASSVRVVSISSNAHKSYKEEQGIQFDTLKEMRQGNPSGLSRLPDAIKRYVARKQGYQA